MSDPAIRSVFLKRLLIVLGTAGVFVPVGCSSRPGGVAFRRFWGFEQTASKNHLGGLLPKMMVSGSSPQSQDPFLDQDFQAIPNATQVAELTETPTPTDQQLASRSPSDAALTLFQDPPVRSQPPSKPELPSDDGNPFRLVQHESSVKDISSAEQTPNVDTPIANSKSPQKLPGDSAQLHRLKTALNQDAKTHLAPKPKMNGAEVARQRVEAIMKNARRQMQLGEYTSALRWAMAAEQLAQRSELFFGPDEDPPAGLVRSLQDRLNVPPQNIEPIAKAMTEQTLSVPPNASTDPPALDIEFPSIEPTENANTQTPPPELASATHSATGAMQEAVIAPETLTSQPVPEPIDPPEFPLPEIVPGQRHARSLKVDARRVNANQGATVSVEGQLNPPVESTLPKLELAPPAIEANVELPTVEVAMTNLSPHETITPPPLPPPSPMEEPQATSQPRFLYADQEPSPAPKAVKNVDWNEAEIIAESQPTGWWIFPLAGVLGGLLLGLVIFKQARR